MASPFCGSAWGFVAVMFRVLQGVLSTRLACNVVVDFADILDNDADVVLSNNKANEHSIILDGTAFLRFCEGFS